MDDKYEGMLDFEIEEMEEEFLKFIGERIEKEENLLSIVNPEKIKQISYAYGVLKHMLEGTKAKISCTLNEPFKSMGCISITGKNLSFNKIASFIIACEQASNVDIFPKTNGTVQIDFTFHGLTLTLEEEGE